MGLLLFACEPASFRLVANVDQDFAYNFDGVNTFEDEEIITSADVQGWLDEVNPEELKELTIESMAINIRQLDGNNTETVKISGEAEFKGSKMLLFTDVTANLADFTNLTSISKNLDPAEVAKFTLLIEKFIRGTETGDLRVKIYGNSVSTGKNVNIIVFLRIRLNSVSEKFVEVPRFIGKP